MAARPRQPEPHDPRLPEGAGEREIPAFSRPAEPSAFGKGDDRIDVIVSTAFKLRVARVARLRGHSTSSAWARTVLEHALLRDEEEIDRIVSETGGDSHWRNRR